MSKQLLNYHDAVVRASDLALLDSPTAWLNDACINFRLTRLQHRHHRREREEEGEGEGEEEDAAVHRHSRRGVDDDDGCDGCGGGEEARADVAAKDEAGTGGRPMRQTTNGGAAGMMIDRLDDLFVDP